MGPSLPAAASNGNSIMQQACMAVNVSMQTGSACPVPKMCAKLAARSKPGLHMPWPRLYADRTEAMCCCTCAYHNIVMHRVTHQGHARQGYSPKLVYHIACTCRYGEPWKDVFMEQAIVTNPCWVVAAPIVLDGQHLGAILWLSSTRCGAQRKAQSNMQET